MKQARKRKGFEKRKKAPPPPRVFFFFPTLVLLSRPPFRSIKKVEKHHHPSALSFLSASLLIHSNQSTYLWCRHGRMRPIKGIQIPALLSKTAEEGKKRWKLKMKATSPKRTREKKRATSEGTAVFAFFSVFSRRPSHVSHTRVRERALPEKSEREASGSYLTPPCSNRSLRAKRAEM
jgi:hypothetical protein